MRIVRTLLVALCPLVSMMIGITDPARADLTFLNHQAYLVPLVLNEMRSMS